MYAHEFPSLHYIEYNGNQRRECEQYYPERKCKFEIALIRLEGYRGCHDPMVEVGLDWPDFEECRRVG